MSWLQRINLFSDPDDTPFAKRTGICLSIIVILSLLGLGVTQFVLSLRSETGLVVVDKPSYSNYLTFKNQNPRCSCFNVFYKMKPLIDSVNIERPRPLCEGVVVTNSSRDFQPLLCKSRWMELPKEEAHWERTNICFAPVFGPSAEHGIKRNLWYRAEGFCSIYLKLRAAALNDSLDVFLFSSVLLSQQDLRETAVSIVNGSISTAKNQYEATYASLKLYDLVAFPLSGYDYHPAKYPIDRPRELDEPRSPGLLEVWRNTSCTYSSSIKECSKTAVLEDQPLWNYTIFEPYVNLELRSPAEVMVDEAMNSDIALEVDYEKYYDQCAPLKCEYYESMTATTVFKVVLNTIGFVGGYKTVATAVGVQIKRYIGLWFGSKT